MASRQLRARRYFAVLIVLLAGLYALVFFTGHSRTPQLGLDLQGGTTVTLSAKTPDGKAPSQADLELARQIIEQRVNGLGVSEAEVVTEGSSNIVISVPGKNGDRARELGATALLRFRPVLQGPEAATPASPSASSSASASASPSATASAAPSSGAPASSSAAPSSSAPASGSAAPSSGAPAAGTTITAGTQDAATAAYATLTCSTSNATTVSEKPTDYLATCSDDGTAKYLLGPAVVEGTQVTDAAAGTQQTTNAWIVTLDLNSAGTKAWATYTAQAAQNHTAVGITLDGRVISAPTVQGAINGGQTQITGSFTQQQATDLANQLKYGALPLTFTQANAQSVSTELGSKQLDAGLIAGAIGIALVFVYALIYYRLLGLVLIVSLGVSALLVYASLVLLSRQLGLALSLAGIAGFIVSIGITADSLVFYFERLKDEIREGRTLRSATPRAWVRARRTILSADAVSFLAAAILYLLAIGDVKGFAFTLGLSTVLDLIVVFLFTHPLLTVLSRFKGFGSNRFSGLGRVDHRGRKPAAPGGGRELVGAGPRNGSTR